MSTTKKTKLVPDLASNRKQFHQLFNLDIGLIFFVVAVSLASIFLLLSEQQKYSQSVITEQLIPIKLKLTEQKQLFKADGLIEKLLNEAKFNELRPLLNELAVQSKKLSLLNTEQKRIYQQWLSNNNTAISFLSDVETKHPHNELLKSKMLILLDTLIDAIDIELSDVEILPKQKLILEKAQNHLMVIVVKLNNLSLKSTLSYFSQFSKEMATLFVEDYSMQLANQNSDNDKIEEIIKDFLRLEDLTVKRGMLSRWEEQLMLVHNYQLKIVEQQDELTLILAELSNRSVDSAGQVTGNNDMPLSLPIWIIMFFSCALLIVLSLLLFLRYKIKAANQLNVSCIRNAIHATKPFSNIYKNKSNLCSVESLQLIKEIQSASEQSYSQAEYLALSEKNTELQQQLEKSEIFHHQRYNELEVRSSKNLPKTIPTSRKEEDITKVDASPHQAKVTNTDSTPQAKTLQNRLEGVSPKSSFDLQRYIKHQGSVELAFFMLEEYISENEALVEQLNQAFVKNDRKQVDVAIKKLQINSNILAADYLTDLCQCWQKALPSADWDNTDKTQIKLLSKTQKAVQDVSLSTEVMT